MPKECILGLVFSYLRTKLRLSFDKISLETGLNKTKLFNWSVGIMPSSPTDLYRLSDYLNNKVKTSSYFERSEKEYGVSFHYLLFGVNQWESQSKDVINYFKNYGVVK